MRLALMQPYLFPYLGYFQLIHAVDLFLIYDDVQFVNRGWVNRNRILLNGEPAYISLPLVSASRTAQIGERELAPRELSRAKLKILGQLRAAYKSAPHFNAVNNLAEAALSFPDLALAPFLANSLQLTCNYLGITTPLRLSSTIERSDQDKAGQYRTIALCKALGASTYINPIGGTMLYQKSVFSEHNLALYFIKMDAITYNQMHPVYTPHLSILDVVAFNPLGQIQEFLNRYTLVEGEAQDDHH